MCSTKGRSGNVIMCATRLCRIMACMRVTSCSTIAGCVSWDLPRADACWWPARRCVGPLKAPQLAATERQRGAVAGQAAVWQHHPAAHHTD